MPFNLFAGLFAPKWAIVDENGKTVLSGGDPYSLHRKMSGRQKPFYASYQGGGIYTDMIGTQYYLVAKNSKALDAFLSEIDNPS